MIVGKFSDNFIYRNSHFGFVILIDEIAKQLVT
ncbi:hypothetical protein BXY58_2704 [Epilithonimonas arachidiradicis]|uniref:Uncharacterized protein n=1 Tax=Epilithonimonas arachidiradicis TaxID=1617282 RepID=A0A420CXX5_9FLAO|nr:hypothetical protein BXY58_2704 [Epilithonimonas arachidiradicis]